tara:strand:+ start:5579 stop:5866 length:288 start_codon:yes stop_codon:yes gene_type:complete
MLNNPKIKPTFFNTRKYGLHWNYTDTNNWLLTIITENNEESNFIFRDLKQLKNPFSLIRERIGSVKYTEYSKISKAEYDMLLNIGTPTLYKFCQN